MVSAMVSTAGSESRIAHDAARRLPLDVAGVSDSPASCASTSAQRARFPEWASLKLGRKEEPRRLGPGLPWFCASLDTQLDVSTGAA